MSMKQSSDFNLFDFQNRPKRKKGRMMRPLLAALLFLIQVGILVFLLYYLNAFVLSVYLVFQIIATLYAISLLSKDTNPSYKLAWVTLILAVPFLGLLFYAMWGRGRYTRNVKKKIPLIAEMKVPFYRINNAAYEHLLEEYPAQGKEATLLVRSGFPVYEHTVTTYYGLGDEYFPELLAECEKAQEFIYLEFFIIAPGECWDKLLEILKVKCSQGIDVRLVYDDFGCITTLPRNFISKMKQFGIKTGVFNPVRPIVNNFYMNYRNHHKICVIDGKVAFTGGINIADEYMNIVNAFGHWKDTGIKLTGSAVLSITSMFLQMWSYVSYSHKRIPMPIELTNFLSKPIYSIQDKCGYVQPFCDGPLNNPDNPAENLYMQIIGSAHKYVYITTPYLVLDNEMITTLCLAADSGIDVRIITPGTPDKKMVYMVTRSFYGTLLRRNVKIYEYVPGFIHAKNLVCDDVQAIVGTVNMDFRSFYLHFENAVWMCGTPTVMDVKEDFLETLGRCRKIEYKEWQSRSWFTKMREVFLKIIAPML